MADKVFENPRLVSIYDHFDGERTDLDHYISIATELKAHSVLDIGCGTGCFACLASSHGFKVTAIDPAKASLDFARSKPNAEQVNWILGDTTVLSQMSIDLAIMTGNVAQVFLTNESWEQNLRLIHQALHPKGHLVFEVRDPKRQDWLNWTPDKTYQQIEIPNIGKVEGWCEVTDVSEELVSFRWNYRFESDGKSISSQSTIRFRSKETIEDSLKSCGYVVSEVRDAPDRPGKEFVFVASVSEA
jgi:ubiquinone/menaquinone biosynthesis C-methylase UbiE